METTMQNQQESDNRSKAKQVLVTDGVSLEHPHPDVCIAKTKISNASWINTTEGTVLLDTLLLPGYSAHIKREILNGGGVLKYILYTHHHYDHIGGAATFIDDDPQIIAHRFFPENIEKYRILKEHRARIATIQFNIAITPEMVPAVVAPTKLFDRSMVFSLGDKTFELYHARAETDDSVWVFVPEIKTAFVGDLIISGFPNIGNPFKPTRFALSWAHALEAVRDKDPAMVIAHGGRAVYRGDEARELLDVTIEAIYSIHDQVVKSINKGIPVDEIIHHVRLPDHLKTHEFLQFKYSRPEFAVYNIHRWYHGYFDHNPANLIPRPHREFNDQLITLIGSRDAIVQRAAELLEQGQAQLALQVLDILLKNNPEDIDARKLHLRILEVLSKEDYCLMSLNTWVYFMDIDRDFLRLKGALE
jgi:alkyl sulfatase BDS1-like metallo-beta-lactamase superfamily hydrolase